MDGRRSIAVGAVLAVMALVTGVVVLRGDGDEVVAEASTSASAVSASRRSEPRPTTSTISPPSTTSTPPTTSAPTTAAPVAPTTTAPTAPPATSPPPPPPPPPAAPPPPPPPPPPAPMRVMVAGDSLGFTAAFPTPSPWELPPTIASVAMHARIGCGVLASTGARPVDTHAEGASPDCGDQARTELEGLGARPDWMVVFSGAWEHLTWNLPDGRVMPAGSPELRHELFSNLAGRAQFAAQFGTRTAFVAWVCPTGVRPERQGTYAHWYNSILRDAARAVPGSIVIEPTDRVCVGGDAGGVPTAEKSAAFVDHHPVDKAWTWQVWLGPALDAARF